MQCPPDKAHLATKTQLRERRMRLAPGQRPVDRYWQGHAWVSLYDPVQAVAMVPRRPATPAQLEALQAGRALAGTFACPMCRSRVPEAVRRPSGACPTCESERLAQAEADELAACWRAVRRDAAAWLAAPSLFVDVETSRLDEAAEIVEIAVLDQAGTVLFHSLVRPSQPIALEATQIHGLTDVAVATAPTWAQIHPSLLALVSGRQLVAHNAPFDHGRIAADCARHGLAEPLANWVCSMGLLTDVNGGRWPSLGRAAALANVPELAQLVRHRAPDDAALCRAIVVSLAATSVDQTDASR